MNLPSRTDPALLDLERRYAALNVEHSNWRDFADRIDLSAFRGEDAFMSQLNYGHDAARYARTYDYLCRLGEGANIRRLGEDGSDGAITFTAPDGTLYSRDLLDSVSELRFIRETLNLMPDSTATMLDIGAGFGRLLYRFAQMYPNGMGYGVDAVPLSTYLCDYYLKRRSVYPRVESVPLDELDRIKNVDFAVNAFSFAEMAYSAIEFWIRFCAEREIRYFIVIPHDYSQQIGAFVSHETDGTNRNYLDLFDKYGYRQTALVSKYLPPEDSPKYAWGTQYAAWELR